VQMPKATNQSSGNGSQPTPVVITSNPGKPGTRDLPRTERKS